MIFVGCIVFMAYMLNNININDCENIYMIFFVNNANIVNNGFLKFQNMDSLFD